MDPDAIADGNRLLTEFKGALTDNFILESLIQQFEGVPRYWQSEIKAEVVFLIQYENKIVPIEVKSDEDVRSKSLAFYRKGFNPGVSIRYSLRNLKLENGQINIPLFLVDQTKKILARR